MNKALVKNVEAIQVVEIWHTTHWTAPHHLAVKRRELFTSRAETKDFHYLLMECYCVQCKTCICECYVYEMFIKKCEMPIITFLPEKYFVIKLEKTWNWDENSQQNEQEQEQSIIKIAVHQFSVDQVIDELFQHYSHPSENTTTAFCLSVHICVWV